jgi:hypothetical protein
LVLRFRSSSTVVHSGPVLGPPCPQPGLSPDTRRRICVKTAYLAVVVVATGERKALGGWWGGLSVPKPPKGVAVAVVPARLVLPRL